MRRLGDSLLHQLRRSLSSTSASKIDPYALPPPASSFPEYDGRSFFRYEIVHKSTKSAARVGRITTPHGSFLTPAFVAVATNAALKAVDHREHTENLPLVFCNTYHLLLHPGPEVVEEAGGLHGFMKRDQPIITDSGGYVLFSKQLYELVSDG